jgi:hypothetical protein
MVALKTYKQRIGMALLRLLEKRVRAHVYLSCMKWEEIKRVLNRHVPNLKSIQILKIGTTKLKDHEEYFILCDEYNWHEDKIVEEAKQELKKEFTKKLPKHLDPVVKAIYVKSLA